MHSVKTRVKDPKRLLQKLVRKTPDRREKYSDNFNFSIQNYKDEITDLMGIRVIHLFKEDWEEIHYPRMTSNTTIEYLKDGKVQLITYGRSEDAEKTFKEMKNIGKDT